MINKKDDDGCDNHRIRNDGNNLYHCCKYLVIIDINILIIVMAIIVYITIVSLL